MAELFGSQTCNPSKNIINKGQKNIYFKACQQIKGSLGKW